MLFKNCYFEINKIRKESSILFDIFKVYLALLFDHCLHPFPRLQLTHISCWHSLGSDHVTLPSHAGHGKPCLSDERLLRTPTQAPYGMEATAH